MQWTKCLIKNNILNRICCSRARKFLVSVPKEGQPNIVGNHDTVGLLLGVQSELKSAVNAHLLATSKVEIKSCRCWFCTWCVLQRVSRLFVCCEIRYDLLNAVHLNFEQSPLLTHFKPMFHFHTHWKRQKTCIFYVFRACRNRLLAWNSLGKIKKVDK